MCGRFAINNETNDLLEEIVAAHGAPAIFDWQQHWPSNYNVAPTQQVPVASDLAGTRLVESVRWGMVAPFAKEFGGKPTINARIETVATNGMFKKPFQEHRVVVPALGYYEWQQRDDGKQPYFVSLPDRSPLALAGIVREWHDPSRPKGDPEGTKLSMAIITMDAHQVPGEVHDREPAILIPEAVEDWLSGDLTDDQRIQLLLSSADEVSNDLTFYEVTRAMNASSVKGEPNNSAAFIEPL